MSNPTDVELLELYGKSVRHSSTDKEYMEASADMVFSELFGD